MTHFSVLIIGDEVEAQLQPYHEFECTGTNDQYVIDVDKTDEARADYEAHRDDPDYPTFRAFLEGWYGADKVIGPGQEPDRNGEHKYGFVRVNASGEVIQYIDRTNPNKRWDYWRVGGRWGDFFLLKPDTHGERADIAWERGREFGGSGAAVRDEERETGRVHADIARKGDIDWEGMAAERMRNAGRDYDTWLRKDHGRLDSAWIYGIEYRPEVDASWKAFWENGRTGPTQEEREAWRSARSTTDLESRDDFMHKAARRAGVARAIVKDGVWMERGKAGWFGTFNDVMEVEEWDRRYWELIESLPDDTTLTIVDCHI